MQRLQLGHFLAGCWKFSKMNMVNNVSQTPKKNEKMRKRMSHEENTLDVECLNLGSFVCGKSKEIVKPSPHVQIAGSTHSQTQDPACRLVCF